jgi:hypothetical protein
MLMRTWKTKIWTIVLLPVVAGVLLACVSVFRGYLHQQAGFDAEGRPVAPALPSTDEPVPKNRSRRPLSSTSVITQIRDDLDRVEAAGQPDCRYFSLAHRHNNPDCPASLIERERQAFRALVRLLSPVDRSPQVTAIDADQVVFRLRLSELGWTGDQWDELTRHYRYGLSHAGSTDAALKEAEIFLRGAIAVPVPIVRADWFITALVSPPLGGPGGSLGMWTKTPPTDIRSVADAYAGEPIGLEAAARELGVEPRVLRELLAGYEVLRDSFGLDPLLRGKTVTREWWESDKNLTSPFQELARRLGLGKPVVLR